VRLSSRSWCEEKCARESAGNQDALLEAKRSDETNDDV
jgi:hypothetical protein